MVRTGGFRRLSLKVVNLSLIALAIGMLIPAAIVYGLLQRSAERETQEKAHMLLATLESARRCTEEDSPAARAPSGKAAHPVDQIASRYSGTAGEYPYKFRRVSLNPANPENLADEQEARLLATFQNSPGLKEIQRETTRERLPYSMVAAPIVVDQDRCIRCHMAPVSAATPRSHPAARLPGTWKRGQVVGAAVVYVPLDFAYGQASRCFWTAFLVTAILALLATGLLVWRVDTLVGKPLSALYQTCHAILNGNWNARFFARQPDEVSGLAIAFQETTMWLRERVASEEKLRSLFQQFIPATVAARALGKDANEILVGARQPVTVMVMNIRNFRLLVDNLPPDETVKTLNEFFTAANKVIVENRGLVSKYLGDTIVAFFGVPIEDGTHTLNAIRAALAIPRAFQNLYVNLDEKHGWELGVGIGISTADAIVGHFGSSEHMEYTVLGDVVLEAHRLEEVTKAVPEEDTILISEPTYRQVMSEVQVVDLGEKPTTGGKTIHAFAVQGLRSEARTALAA